MLIEIFAAIMIGYFLGSIPFALVIGKLFYQTDIRNYGRRLSQKHILQTGYVNYSGYRGTVYENSSNRCIFRF